MIVAFLDLLGFTNLLETNAEAAFDNMNAFNHVIHTKVIDSLSHPLSEYKRNNPDDKELHKFVENSSVTSFDYMISVSDSLIIGAKDVDLFINQLRNFVASVYINYSEPFVRPFVDIRDVESDKWVTCREDGSIRCHKAFPILFRGGISFGEDVGFFKEYHIFESESEQTSLNVFGKTYLKAVQLENTGKGPRLFCDRSVVDAISNKKLIKIVDEDSGTYEIVWTIGGCETVGKSADKWENVKRSIHKKMLPPAVNLYQYFKTEDKLEPHYKGLLDIVCCGIVKYAQDECDKADKAIDYINDYLTKHGIDKLINRDVIEGFLM